MGIKIFGQNYGRFAKAYWLVICIHDTIVPVDIQVLSKEYDCDFWRDMKTTLFENPNILKIFHNHRLDVDYLFHSPETKCIQIKNIFDTQVI